MADEVIEEPLGGAHRNPKRASEAIRTALERNLQELEGLKEADLLENRYQKYRNMGDFLESKPAPKKKTAKEKTART